MDGERGSIRHCGGSYQIRVRAGTDPVTGKELVLTGSASTLEDAKDVRRRLLVQVDDAMHAKTKATFRAAYEKWLRVGELDGTTREDYARYARLHFYPLFGDEPAARISADMLEEFYAELRRCSRRCRRGKPAIDHRTTRPHECRVIRHKRRPGRPRRDEPHDCVTAACVVVECPPHRCRPLAPATIRKMHFAIQGALTAAKRWGWITHNPAEIATSRRAVQLRYLDGYSNETAAELVGSTPGALAQNAMSARKRLAKELGDLANRPVPWVATVPHNLAVQAALAETGNDMPAALAWLRRQGVHVDESYAYQS